MADDDEGVISQNPNLVKLLTDRLPSLGLDYETYGPYVWGVVDNTDEDELMEVMQLLQASSEDYADDEDKWTQLTTDIQAAMKQDKEVRQALDREKIDAERIKMEEQLAKAKLEQANQPPRDAKSQKSSTVDDATKKALMQRYAYEDDDEEGGGGKAGGGGGGDAGEEVQTNRQVAAQANLERAKEARSKKVQTKKEEQQKTKEQRLNKEKLKEERRKKSTKGERKR